MSSLPLDSRGVQSRTEETARTDAGGNGSRTERSSQLTGVFSLRELSNPQRGRILTVWRWTSLIGGGFVLVYSAYLMGSGRFGGWTPGYVTVLAIAGLLVGTAFLVPRGDVLELDTSGSRLRLVLSGGLVLEISPATLGRRVVLLEPAGAAEGGRSQTRRGSVYYARVGLRWVPLTEPAFAAFTSHLSRLGYSRASTSGSTKQAFKGFSRVILTSQSHET